MKNRKVAIYTRVSDPRDTRQSPEAQLHELKQYAKQRDWDVYAVYLDRMSGKNIQDRKNFNLMMGHAKEHKFQTVLVWALDRFCRSVKDFHNSIQQLSLEGINLISVKESLDTDKKNPMSNMLMGILAVFAEFEREVISDRVKAGIARRRRAGKQVGRQPLTDLKVGYIIERHNAGDSLREIQRRYKQAIGKGVSIETIRKYIRKVKA